MHVRQAANVIELLEFFVRAGAPATLAEIADGLDWPRSSTFNMVETLLEKGYLYEPVRRGAFYPSPRWQSLAERLGGNDAVPRLLCDVVDEIGRRTGETVALGAASGRSVVLLHVAESPQPIRYAAAKGTLAPIHATSLGRALIAQMETKEREGLYRRLVFRKLADNTPISVAEVEAALLEGQRRGYHQSHSEEINDLVGVSLPVPYGARRFSIVTSGPVSRCLGRRPEIARIMVESLRAAGLMPHAELDRPAGTTAPAAVGG